MQGKFIKGWNTSEIFFGNIILLRLLSFPWINSEYVGDQTRYEKKIDKRKHLKCLTEFEWFLPKFR